MSNDLEPMEKELKKLYSCEVEFSQSIEIQRIVDHCRFSLTDLSKVLKGGIFAGPKSGMIPNSGVFHTNASTIGWTVEQGHKKIRWIYCEDTRHQPPTLYVMGFPAARELKFCNYLKKMDRLKAFL